MVCVRQRGKCKSASGSKLATWLVGFWCRTQYRCGNNVIIRIVMTSLENGIKQ